MKDESQQQSELQQDPLIQQVLARDPEQVYAQGYAAWQQQDFDEARIHFSWLVMSQPWSWRAQVALAGVLMMQQEYVLAIDHYGYALILDASHPEPVCQIAVCLQALGDDTAARQALQTALAMSYDDPSHDDVRLRAEHLLQQLLI